jgi:hypothetical protein
MMFFYGRPPLQNQPVSRLVLYPFRFRRSFRIAPGVRVNLRKSGVSESIGPRGFRLTLGRRGARTTVRIPGTGVSYTEQQRISGPSQTSEAPRPGLSWLVALLLIGIAVVLAMVFARQRGDPGDPLGAG